MTPPWKNRLNKILKDRGLARTEVSVAAGLSPTFLTDLFAGSDPSVGKLSAICRVLGTSLGELYDGGDAVAQEIPIIGTVRAGEGWIAADDRLGEVIMRVAGRPVGLEVGGDSMSPVYRHGDVLIGSQRVGDNPSAIVGKDCIVLTDDGGRFVKVVVKSSIRGRVSLRSYNPRNEDMRDVRLEWAAPIEWVRRG